MDGMGEDRLKVFEMKVGEGFYRKEVVWNCLEKCNVVKIKDEEVVSVRGMLGYGGIEVEDKWWIVVGKYKVKMLIVSCGVKGRYVFSGGNV